MEIFVSQWLSVIFIFHKTIASLLLFMQHKYLTKKFISLHFPLIFIYQPWNSAPFRGIFLICRLVLSSKAIFSNFPPNILMKCGPNDLCWVLACDKPVTQETHGSDWHHRNPCGRRGAHQPFLISHLSSRCFSFQCKIWAVWIILPSFFMARIWAVVYSGCNLQCPPRDPP